MTPGERPIVIASNRGPVNYTLNDGRLTASRGGGGLVSGLAPLLDEGRAIWIAAAMSDADRQAAAAGLPDSSDLPVHLLGIDPEDQRKFYDVVSNETLWFVHHALFDLTRIPNFDDEFYDAWDAYRRVNGAFAASVNELAPEGAVVLVQDYHLTLLAPEVKTSRPDLTLVHFHHTPFAGPDNMRVLPTDVLEEMLTSLGAHAACGFHTSSWAANYAEAQRRWHPDGVEPRTFVASLNSDVEELRRTASSPECETAFAELCERIGDRRLIVRVDRMELSKNIVRGFAAYDLLLSNRPDLRHNVTFLACCYPSRLGVPAYAAYRDEVIAAAAAVNERWGDGDWQPIELLTDDDYPRSVAALRRYDVLVVNPVRDGLNLVAKEGPMLNEHDGQLVLSIEAGAWAELRDAADGVSPFDIRQTAAAIGAALDRAGDDRRDRARTLRSAAGARTPADWLADQLAAAS